MSYLKAGTEKITSNLVKGILDLHGNASLYEKSIHEDQGAWFFIIRNGIEKQLVVSSGESNADISDFSGKRYKNGDIDYLVCGMSHKNADAIRKRFDFTRPVLIGKANSYGFGDRLGNAGPAHLRAVSQTKFRPVLAQQSIRELQRTGRTAEEVMDAATWSVFQEGYHDGFGADGDHLKNFNDIDLMVRAGFTMFTIDPSEYVQNEAKSMHEQKLDSAYQDLPWDEIEDTPDDFLHRYLDLSVKLRDGFTLSPGKAEIMQGMVKYGRVITHTRNLAEYITTTYPDHPAELELSIDETDEPTTLFEHFLIVSELDRLGVELVSLAPRFCGHFEKGVDFRGDLNQFRNEYKQHLAIAEMFGGYKLSIHSGSDKFSVYKVIGSLNLGAVHVKTAGTSYLEALRTVAVAAPDFFREILKFSLKRFETDKKTYHISADPKHIPDPDSLGDKELPGLLNDDDARQVLHVAFGSILSGDLPGAKGFKKRLMELLEKNEELHEKYLVRHFEKHLEPFG